MTITAMHAWRSAMTESFRQLEQRKKGITQNFVRFYLLTFTLSHVKISAISTNAMTELSAAFERFRESADGASRPEEAGAVSFPSRFAQRRSAV